ncbi:hypothetical protein [Hansschlegelia beijingensis]|uniref:Uncharacterized protein n=1 Tax=Hansschlegelia beijingensis TaxID=1133344 RepID=A0A7W6GG94_9HYPH|nr:hypothetical protein [Hansschlegelia beijingensis]MBB3973863.1 hypothetical protein [Hansschlegelia beijingensis]
MRSRPNSAIVATASAAPPSIAKITPSTPIPRERVAAGGALAGRPGAELPNRGEDGPDAAAPFAATDGPDGEAPCDPEGAPAADPEGELDAVAGLPAADCGEPEGALAGAGPEGEAVLASAAGEAAAPAAGFAATPAAVAGFAAGFPAALVGLAGELGDEAGLGDAAAGFAAAGPAGAATGLAGSAAGFGASAAGLGAAVLAASDVDEPDDAAGFGFGVRSVAERLSVWGFGRAPGPLLPLCPLPGPFGSAIGRSLRCEKGPPADDPLS